MDFDFLAIAAVASLLGFGAISGVALTGAKILIGIVLIMFILVLLGIVASPEPGPAATGNRRLDRPYSAAWKAALNSPR